MEKALYKYNLGVIPSKHIPRRKARGMFSFNGRFYSYGISDYLYQYDSDWNTSDSLEIVHLPVKANNYGIHKYATRNDQVFLAGYNTLYVLETGSKRLLPWRIDCLDTSTDRDEVRNLVFFNDSLYVATKRGGIKAIDILSRKCRSFHIKAKDGANWHFFRDMKNGRSNSSFWLGSENGLAHFNEGGTDLMTRKSVTKNGSLIGLIDRFTSIGDTLYGINDQGYLVEITPSEIHKKKEKVHSGRVTRAMTNIDEKVITLSDRSISIYNIRDASKREFTNKQILGISKFRNVQKLNDSTLIFSGQEGHTLLSSRYLGTNHSIIAPRALFISYIDKRKYRIDSVRSNSIRLSSHSDQIALYVGNSDHDYSEEYRLYYSLNQSDWIVSPNNPIVIGNLPFGRNNIRFKEVEGLTESSISSYIIFKDKPLQHKWWFWMLILCVLALLSFMIYKRRVDQIQKKAAKEIEENRKREAERASFEIKINNLEMEALQSQMNPHFIFNSLNALKSMILKMEVDKSAEYLQKFSSMVRKILQSSRTQLVSLEDELQMLKLYLEFETLRFEKPISIHWEVEPTLDLSFFEIPPLLIQPFVENAIWHGLLHLKHRNPILTIAVKSVEDHILIQVIDNGIGRKKSRILNASRVQHKSIGIDLTKERIALYKRITGNKIEITIHDIDEDSGTIVDILLLDHLG